MSQPPDLTTTTPPPTRQLNRTTAALAIGLSAVIIALSLLAGRRGNEAQTAAALAAVQPEPPPQVMMPTPPPQPYRPQFYAQPEPEPLDTYEPPALSEGSYDVPQTPPPSPRELAASAPILFSKATTAGPGGSQRPDFPATALRGMPDPQAFLSSLPGLNPPQMPDLTNALGAITGAFPGNTPPAPTPWESHDQKDRAAIKLQPTQPQAPHLAAGTFISAALLSAVDSAQPGDIIGVTTRDALDQNFQRVLLPRGTRLVGSYGQAAPSGVHLYIAWGRMILPDGTTYDLPSLESTSLQGTAGVPGNRITHFGRAFGQALLLGIVSAGAQLAAPEPTRAGALLTPQQTAAGALAEQISALSVERLRRIPSPTIRLAPGTQFQVLVNRPIELLPLAR